MIMSLCKKGLHSFLGFTNSLDSPPSLQSSPSKVPGSSVGLSTATGEFPRGPNVVESTAVSSPPAAVKKEPRGFGFFDEIGGGGVVVDGLMSCTESLGFESSDDLWADEWLPAGLSVPVERTVSRRETSERRRETTTFPPPISSLNRNGQRSFFLRPMRSEGRLELTEVRIDRPEILRASREDGRLRLELIIDEDIETEEQEREEEEGIEEEQEMIGEEQEMIEEEEEMIEESHEEMQEEQDFAVERFQEEQQPGVGEWKISVSSDGIGRCHEIVSHHHHHNLWRQPCVPIR